MDIDNKQLEKDVENAFRARGLKEQIRVWEAARAPQVEERKPSVWPKIRRVVYAASVAAVVVGVVAMPESLKRSAFKQVYRWGYEVYAYCFGEPKVTHLKVHQNTIEELMAMADSSVTAIAESYYEQEILGHENPMHEVVWMVLAGDYEMAQTLLEETRETLSEDDAHYQQIIEDIEYLDALCSLGQNKRSEAIRKLKKIAASESRHSEVAAALAKKC